MPAHAQGGSAPLAGTSWRLVELNGQPVIGEEPFTLQFAADEQRVSGYGGCNQYSGPYTQNGASLRFGPLASTRRACLEPALNTQETAYFAALDSTTRYSIENGISCCTAATRSSRASSRVAGEWHGSLLASVDG